MTGDTPAPPPAPDTALQSAATEAVAKAEAAATRRRWINLGEFVAVGGLIIAGVSLWLTWSDRRADLAEKKAEQTATANAKARYDVRAKVDGKDLTLIADDTHTLGDISVAFPADLGIATQASATPVISASWYEGALMKATDGGADDQTGKLPVLLTVNYTDGNAQRTTTGIYDIVWRTNGRALLGRAFHVVALRLHRIGGTQAEVDRLWQKERPTTR